MCFRRYVVRLIFLLIGQSVFAQNTAYTLESVPDPKNNGGGYVSNPDGILDNGDVNVLNQLIASMEDSTTAQVAVVIVQSIGEENPKDFATRLFNKWGIGQAGTDNGLLIFTVMDQRRTEFETGYGLEAVLPDAICYRIGMQELVPEFQQGRYGQGLIRAVRRIKYTLEDPKALEEIKASPNRSYGGTRNSIRSLYIVLTIYGIITLILSTYFLGRIFHILRSRDELYDKYLDLRKVYWLFLVFLIPLPYIFMYWYLNRKLRSLRRQPRFSRTTGEPMRLLTEAEEDPYLERGQITEEEIGTVDYDVWVSESGDETMILRYKKRFTYYKECPKCHYLTYYHAYTQTIRQPTYTSTGQQKIVHKCKNCNEQKTTIKTLPVLTRSSGGSGSSGGGGGSWGGGSSGGGGGGVSW